MSKGKTTHWTICPECDGFGKKTQKLGKKARRFYQKELMKYKENGRIGLMPFQPKRHTNICDNCMGSGLISSDCCSSVNTNYPQIAIIGGGISGVALAVACFHRGIPFTLYEKDISFDARSQGYGLTLQQANKAMEGFGIFGLKDGIRTTKHLVHNTDGKVIGEWGKKKETTNNKKTKQKNIHIPRQSLRMQLLAQLKDSYSVKWGYRLMNLSQNNDGKTELVFQAYDTVEKVEADLVVGADGIRSMVRELSIGREVNPLCYTGYIVILGICSLDEIIDTKNSLLDSETIFQTVNGHERIYVMPYSQDAVMWQMSFPIAEEEARTLSHKGADALKQEAIHRAQWHNPIPQILSATPLGKITGYPVYDRETLTVEHLKNVGNITLIGDAAHPMSPFKGQGANRALLDALALSREIYRGCESGSEWKKNGIRKAVLEKFEYEMIQQSAPKVQASREAGQLLHSDAVLHEGETPRGRGIKPKLNSDYK